MSALPQLELFSPFDEAGLYHDTRAYGFFSLLAADRAGVKRQSSYRLPLMPQVIRHLARDRDTWLSQGEFIKPNRRLVNLARIGLLFVDLDCYKLDIEPAFAAGMLEDECEHRGIPAPSVIVHSGRGIYAKWLLDKPLARAALPRWNAVQAELVRAFEHIGADPGARDAARVLRLVGTVNSKSGTVAHVLRMQAARQGDEDEAVRYGFEYLCECILPRARWDLDAERAERTQARIEQQTQQQEKRERRLQIIEGDGAKRRPGIGLNGRSLAWSRMEDLRTLARLRGGVAQGGREVWLFWMLNFLCLSGATNSTQLWHEARALAGEIGYDEHTQAEMSTVYRKAQDFESGKTVDFGGRQWPALYTPRNATLIDIFGITEREQTQLKTIVSPDEARRRDAAAARARRAAAGAKPRAGAESRAMARLMRSQGMSARAIAAEINVSHPTVLKWLAEGR